MLDERTKQVLYAVVQSYINNPEPVGSRLVTKKYPFCCSPATIRNIMADLEDLGFLGQPHTSAGRIPTDKGYRFYVNSLSDKGLNGFLHSSEEEDNAPRLYHEKIANEFTKKIESMRNDMSRVFTEATNMLSSMSNYVGIALPPKPGNTTFNRIEFIKYKGDRIAVILITDEGIIKNSIISADPISQEDLNRIANYLNAEYSGYSLDDIRKTLIKRMRHEKTVWDKLIAHAIKMYEQTITSDGDDIFVSGLYNVMNLPDFSDISRIKEMARAIKDKHLILKLLDEVSNAEGVQVMIGNENHAEEMRNLSIVASSYKEGDRPMGVIALIGPKRMNYPQAICMVDAVAKCLSKAFR
jgi:heat-inducible transcriptional repressor